MDLKINELYEKIEKYSMEIQNSYGFTDNSPEYHELMEKFMTLNFKVLKVI